MVSGKGIVLNEVSFRIGEFCLDAVSLQVEPGEYFVLSGPNGAGKTVLLKLIAGIYESASGSIFLGTGDVTAVPPWRRNIGYVPQDGVLFPSKNVRKNIAFGLEVRKMGKEEISGKVMEIAELLGISHLLDRMPEGLSGGERQKAALARALVIKPSVLLLDEPVSAIDEDTRDQLCIELARIQKEIGVTTVHVSHNRRETELVAEKIGILRNGGIEIQER